MSTGPSLLRTSRQKGLNRGFRADVEFADEDLFSKDRVFEEVGGRRAAAARADSHA